MADQFTVSAPEFDRIKDETGVATRDGFITLWRVANDEAKSRRAGVREAIERINPKGVTITQLANLNDLDTQMAGVLVFDGAASVDLTGLQARPDFTFLYLFTLGAGTITVKNSSASSIDRNKILTNSGGNLALTTNLGTLLFYLNTRWREFKLA